MSNIELVTSEQDTELTDQTASVELSLSELDMVGGGTFNVVY
jgi:hypothetical protein